MGGLMGCLLFAGAGIGVALGVALSGVAVGLIALGGVAVGVWAEGGTWWSWLTWADLPVWMRWVVYPFVSSRFGWTLGCLLVVLLASIGVSSWMSAREQRRVGEVGALAG